MKMTAQTCQCAGFSTFLTNLVSSSTLPANDCARPWVEQYGRGLSCEIYRLRLSARFEGLSFSACALEIYLQNQAVFFAVKPRDGDEALLFPGSEYELKGGDVGYFIAQHFKVIESLADDADEKGLSSPFPSYRVPSNTASFVANILEKFAVRSGASDSKKKAGASQESSRLVPEFIRRKETARTTKLAPYHLGSIAPLSASMREKTKDSALREQLMQDAESRGQQEDILSQAESNIHRNDNPQSPSAIHPRESTWHRSKKLDNGHRLKELQLKAARSRARIKEGALFVDKSKMEEGDDSSITAENTRDMSLVTRSDAESLPLTRKESLEKAVLEVWQELYQHDDAASSLLGSFDCRRQNSSDMKGNSSDMKGIGILLKPEPLYSCAQKYPPLLSIEIGSTPSSDFVHDMRKVTAQFAKGAHDRSWSSFSLSRINLLVAYDLQKHAIVKSDHISPQMRDHILVITPTLFGISDFLQPLRCYNTVLYHHHISIFCTTITATRRTVTTNDRCPTIAWQSSISPPTTTTTTVHQGVSPQHCSPCSNAKRA
jgi:hypothetical protein